MTADRLLRQLPGTRSTGKSTWIAQCPAHEDKHPSLAIRELDDGRVLLHCFVGCSAGEVVAALGMTLSDLFPLRTDGSIDHRQRRERRPFPATDALRCIAVEAMLVVISATRLANGGAPTDADRRRLLLAASRIQAAVDAVGVTQ